MSFWYNAVRVAVKPLLIIIWPMRFLYNADRKSFIVQSIQIVFVK
jgi:hypothetical protein